MHDIKIGGVHCLFGGLQLANRSVSYWPLWSFEVGCGCFLSQEPQCRGAKFQDYMLMGLFGGPESATREPGKRYVLPGMLR